MWFRKRIARIGILGLVATSAGLLAGSFSPANASLTNTSLVMSNNQIGASSTYTEIFSTGSALVTDLLVGVPSGVTGLTAAGTSVYTAASCTGTFTQQTITGAVLGTGSTNLLLPLSVPSLGTCVKVVMTGLTNPGSVASTYACGGDALAAILGATGGLSVANVGALTCGISGLTGGNLGALLADTTGIAVNFVAQATNGISTALNVAPALTTSIDNTYQSFSIIPAAGGAEASGAVQNLTVGTNAQNYTVEGLVSGATSELTWAGGAGHNIPLGYTQSTGGTAAACSGSGTQFGANGTYAALQSGVTGLTNGKITNINYCWNVDFTDPAGLYNATVTYLVVPTF